MERCKSGECAVIEIISTSHEKAHNAESQFTQTFNALRFDAHFMDFNHQ